MLTHCTMNTPAPNRPIGEPPSGAVTTSPARLRYVAAGGLCVATAAGAWPLSTWLDAPNTVMLFLLPVVYAAFRLGRGPAAFAAVCSVALFDFFFVPPQWSFAVADVQYLLTFAVMLIVGLTIAHLSEVLRARAEDAARREQQTHALYELAHELAGTITLSQVAESVERFATSVLTTPALLLVKGTDGELTPADARTAVPSWVHLPTAMLARDGGRCTDIDAEPAVAYVPLRTTHGTRGVLVTQLRRDGSDAERHAALLEAVGSLLATAIERLHFVDIASSTQLAIETERLRTSILSALSHDVRTPLTAMVGMADTLAGGHGTGEAVVRDLATRIRDQGRRISDMITNLLEMARLQTGGVKLRLEWQPLTEVVGSSITLLGDALARHPVTIDIPRDFPLLRFDAVLMERVMCNLLENAAKYAPAGTAITVSAQADGDLAAITIRDGGPGLPEHRDVFGLFVRGTRESSQPGVGLGLAICRAIMEAHRGTISARNTGAGAEIRLTLPLGQPPVIATEDA